MDKNVATANFLQKDPLSGVVQKTGVVPRNASLTEKNKAKNAMLSAGFTTTEGQAKRKPSRRPKERRGTAFKQERRQQRRDSRNFRDQNCVLGRLPNTLIRLGHSGNT